MHKIEDGGWTHIKIRTRTKERLQLMAEEMQRNMEEGRCEAFWRGERCSIGELLNYLMNRVIAKRQRAKKSRDIARKNRADAILALTFVPVG